MNCNVAIENLACFPHYLALIAEWHHQEWLRGRVDIAAVDNEDGLNKRISLLETHLDDASIPSTFVAFLNGEPVGSASVVFYQFSRNQSKSPWLTNVYVCEQHRETGIGERLLSHSCEQAKRAGIDKLSLYTHDREKYYIKRGWMNLRTGQLQKRPVSILEKYL